MADAVEPHDNSDSHGHDDWHHKPFSAHHFEDAEQQFDSGKLGMWLFLITEILFFSGLFCAYAVYRYNHPEVFEYASQYLNKYLGGLNTIVLIFSSLTMAWAVRCAQLGKRGGLITMLSLTLFCAALFLGVKTFEYTEKAHKRLLWAGASVNASDIGKKSHVFKLGEPLDPEKFEDRMMESLEGIQRFWFICLISSFVLVGVGFYINVRWFRTTACSLTLSIAGIMIGIAFSIMLHEMQHGGGGHGEGHGTVAEAHDHDGEEHGDHAEKNDAEHKDHAHEEGEEKGEHKEPSSDHAKEGHDERSGEHPKEEHTGEELAEAGHASTGEKSDAPNNVNIFFSIYYFMTGLHGFHIVAGMIAITWLLVRAVESHFRPDYFGPVDFVGLYWHIVDLIWIFLFPLLYLIGSGTH